MKKVLTCGSFDLFHPGHVNFLNNCKSAMGEYNKFCAWDETELIVCVSTDEFHKTKKGCYPIMTFEERKEMVSALPCVDVIFAENSWDTKKDLAVGCDLFVIGEDWKGRFDNLDCPTRYISRTGGISTSEIIERVKKLE